MSIVKIKRPAHVFYQNRGCLTYSRLQICPLTYFLSLNVQFQILYQNAKSYFQTLLLSNLCTSFYYQTCYVSAAGAFKLLEKNRRIIQSGGIEIILEYTFPQLPPIEKLDENRPRDKINKDQEENQERPNNRETAALSIKLSTSANAEAR